MTIDYKNAKITCFMLKKANEHVILIITGIILFDKTVLAIVDNAHGRSKCACSTFQDNEDTVHGS